VHFEVIDNLTYGDIQDSKAEALTKDIIPFSVQFDSQLSSTTVVLPLFVKLVRDIGPRKCKLLY